VRSSGRTILINELEVIWKETFVGSFNSICLDVPGFWKVVHISNMLAEKILWQVSFWTALNLCSVRPLSDGDFNPVCVHWAAVVLQQCVSADQPWFHCSLCPLSNCDLLQCVSAEQPWFPCSLCPLSTKIFCGVCPLSRRDFNAVRVHWAVLNACAVCPLSSRDFTAICVH